LRYFISGCLTETGIIILLPLTGGFFIFPPIHTRFLPVHSCRAFPAAFFGQFLQCSFKTCCREKNYFSLLFLPIGVNALLFWQNSRAERTRTDSRCSLQASKKMEHLFGPVLQGALINLN
jgi:hypothetical protein